MTDHQFRPTAYLLESCPFCLKFMIFLAEAGLLDQFVIKSFATGTDGAAAIRAELEPHFEKVTFPTVQIAPGEYRNETDALIEHYTPQASKRPAEMRLLNYYLTGVFQEIGKLFRENMALKAQAQAHATPA